ncbi:MAG TPA: CHAT domain-containing protein [Bryobacteraceae bacterium]|nr:CHAT domain-containing protein [Bryobacteraceae bacterium]
MAGCSTEPAALFQLAKTQFEHGDLSSARENAQRGYERYRNKPNSKWYWKYKLQCAEMRLYNGRTDEAERLLDAAPAPEFAEVLPRYQMLKGYARYRKRQISSGRAFLNAAKAGAHALKNAELEADICLLSGVCALHYEDDGPRARDEFKTVLSIAEAQPLDYQRSAALINLGDLELRRAHCGDAFPYLSKAVEISKHAGFEILQSRALGNMANCYQNLGELDKALQIREQAVAIQTRPRSQLATVLSQSYSALGNIYLEKGNTAKAVEYFRKALEQVNKDAPVQYGQAAGSLAQALERTGSLDEAERYNQAGLQAISQKDTDGVASLTLNAAAIAEHRKQHDNAKAAYERVVRMSSNIPSALWQAYAGLAAIYGEAGDFKNANRHYEQALHVIESNRADQLYSKYKISFLNSLIHLYQEYVALLMKQNDPGKALEVADSSRASVLTEGLVGKRDARKKQLAREVQRAAKTGQCVFLFYWLAPEHSYLWATTEKGSTLIELPDRQQIDRDVQSYLALIQERRDPLAASSPAGQRLYRTLIGPVEHLVPKGGRVVVVPDGSLHSLNFETLISDVPTPHYWLEDVTVSVAPSLGILKAAQSTSSGMEAVLLMGDPVMDGTGFEGLPEAAHEIERVQQHFPDIERAVYTREKATPEAYGATVPRRFSTIHFATHVEPNEQSPLDSAIILSGRGNGYRLYARDVAELPLNADLVTISACRGAGTRTLSGEGLVGFAWAFFQAGARNVVTSLWDANDVSTTELMDRFYAGIETRHTYPNALRDAKLWMLESKYRKPYYWAPFQLYSLLSIDSSVTAESSPTARVSKLSEVKAIGETGHLNRR